MAKVISYIGFCVFLCTLWMQRSMCADVISFTAQESHHEIDEYWTEERIASAKPIDTLLNLTAVYMASEQNLDLSASIQLKVEGIKPKQLDVKSTMGRLFFSIGNGNYVCSANVVASGNGDVIATAKHCGFNSNGQNYRFAPSYDRGNAPHGWWTWRKALLPGDSSDTSFIVLNAQNGRHVQNVVGSEGLVFGRTPQSLGHIHLWGIPASENYLMHSEGQAGSRDNGANVSIPGANSLGGGASGGAFLMQDGNFYQIATYLGICGGEPCGPLFRDASLAAYNAAKNA